MNFKFLASMSFLTMVIMLPFSASAKTHRPVLKPAVKEAPFCPAGKPLSRDVSTVDSCQKSCTIDADCGIGGTCNTGLCEHKTDYCMNDRWSVNERGEFWNCNAYRCDTSNGLCRRQAVGADNCTTGYVFDGKNSCIPSINCSPNDISCQDIYQRWLKARHDYELQTPQPNPVPFSCVACKTNDECDSSQMCWQGRCEKADLYCNTDEAGNQTVMDRNGVVANCANFACDPIAKACLNQCQSNQDCRSGLACVAGSCK